MRFWNTALLVLLAAPGVIEAATFSPPAKFTDGARKYELSRTASHCMAFDSSGTLHLAYFAETRKDLTTPEYPNYVYHQAWRRGAGWSAADLVDDSIVPGVGRIGGRHPSLAIAPDGTVWVAWQDHRHCAEAGHWIDNTEIYADRQAPGGSFSPTDLRLTTSSAPHYGDNGYTPKIVAHSSGRLSVAWHDFNADPDISDIYLKTSSLAGNFDLGESMASMRMTDKTLRGNSPEFTVVDLAADSAGTRHLTWVGGQNSTGDLYYGEAAVGATSVAKRLLAANATDFFNPPHIAVAPNDDVWVAYGDKTTPGGEDVTLLRRRAGQTDFDAPIVIASNPARQYSPDLTIDAQGRLRLAWIDERDLAGPKVYYGLYDPSSGQLLDDTPLTGASTAWARPTLALDTRGNAFVVFEENRGTIAGDLWFTTNGPTTAGARGHWQTYE
ncbi:MAG: hypothetical protein NTW86_19895 [Candidatus Sumerlaeota bacterium]|nr:hypothetical protein [Candidatus Sumerlaeota bacterium]